MRDGDRSVQARRSLCLRKCSLSCVRERKGGSRTRLSLIALHAELGKQMSHIVALPFYGCCCFILSRMRPLRTFSSYLG